MRVPLVTKSNKIMPIEMYNAVENTRKLALVRYVVKPNHLEQKLCIAKAFLVLAAMLLSLNTEKDTNVAAAYISL